MTFDITITFTVSEIASEGEASEFASNLAEHVLDTFNDDESIAPTVGIEVKKS